MDFDDLPTDTPPSSPIIVVRQLVRNESTIAYLVMPAAARASVIASVSPVHPMLLRTGGWLVSW